MAARSSRHIEPLLPLITFVSDTDTGSGSDNQTLTAVNSSSDTGSGSDVGGISVVSTDTSASDYIPEFSDTFTDTSGTNLSSHTAADGTTWTKHPSYTGDLKISNANRLRADSSNTGVYYASGVPVSADYDVQADLYVASLGSGGITGVAGRANTTVDTMYQGRYNVDNNAYELTKRVSGAVTVLGTFPGTPGVGTTNSLRLRMAGSQISLYLNDVQVIGPVTDTSITTAGRAAVRLVTGSDTGGLHLDNLQVLDRASLVPTESAAISTTLTDTGSGSDTGTQGLQTSSTDTGSGSSEVAAVTVPATDTATGDDSTVTLAAVLSDTDQNRTARGDIDSAAASESLGNQVRSDADTAAGADTISAQGFSLAETAAAADTNSLANTNSTSDTGSGSENQIVGRAFSTSDTGTGTDVGTQRRFIVDVDAGRGETDFTTPTSADTATGADVAVRTGFPDTDSGSGSDTQSLSISLQTNVSDTDSARTYDGNIYPLVSGPLSFFWGADLSAVGVHADDTNHACLWGALMDGPNTYGGGFQDAPYDTNTWDLFETHAGKKVSILHFGYGTDEPLTHDFNYHKDMMDRIRSRGAIPLVDLGAWGTPLADVASGTYDTQYTTWFTQAAAWGHPFMLRFCWEMNGSWFDWGTAAGNALGNTTTDFVNAWKHVHNLAVAAGAVNITWVWCPNIDYVGGATISSLYPGDAYVDWLGVDGYNQSTGAAWTSFYDTFNATYAILRGLSSAKPIAICETSSREVTPGGAGQTKDQWITDMFSVLPVSFPAVKALVWFNELNADGNPNNDYAIESSVAAQAAFAAGIADAYYSTNIYGSLPDDTVIEAPSWGVEGLRAINVAAGESGTSAEVGTVTTTSTDAFVSSSDTGTGLDTESVVNNGIIGDTDSSDSSVDDIGDRALGDEDATATASEAENVQPIDDDNNGLLDSAEGDDEENLFITDSDICFGADEESFVVMSADTGTGTDATDPLPPADRDSIVVSETVALKQVTFDTGTGTETNQLANTQNLFGSDIGQGLEGQEHIYITLTDSGTASETTGNRGISDPDSGTASVETYVLRALGLTTQDSGVGRSFGVVSLPLPEDDPDTLSLTADPTAGTLSLTADPTAGTLTIAADPTSTLALTADPTGTLVLTPDGDTVEA